MKVHLSGGPRMGHTWCDLPSPRHATGNRAKATCSACQLAFDEVQVAPRRLHADRKPASGEGRCTCRAFSGAAGCPKHGWDAKP
jgi:hypothetical protein